jgi:tetratricopeptide (TPR) repeat protein
MTIEAEFNAALKLHQAGQLDQAAAGYRRVLAAVPSLPAAMGYLGLVSAQRRPDQLARRLLVRASGLEPFDAAVLSNLGNVLVALGLGVDADRCYRRAAALAPDSGTVHFNLAALAPTSRQKASRYAAALACDPTSSAAMTGLAIVLDTLPGRSGRAWGRRAAVLWPAEPSTHLVISDHRLLRGDAPAAQAAAMRATALMMDPAPALFRLALAADRLRDLDAAGRDCRRSLALAPSLGEAHSLLGSLEFGMGYPAIAVAAYGRAAAIAPDESAQGNGLFALTFLAHDDPQAVVRANRRWGHGHRIDAADAPTRSLPPGGRLRVGYVSPEFTKHGFLSHLLPMLAHHDRSRFELFGYSQTPRSDEWTARVQQHFDRWRDIASLPLDRQAHAIRNDGIDILINLTSYLAHQRLLFARRMAPLQLAYGNFVSTTGLPTIDARITDQWLDPEHAPFLDHAERLVRLRTGYLSYAPPASPEIAPPPSLSAAFVTYGVFNNIAKASDAALAVWATILSRTNSARILLKGAGLDACRARDRILAAFAARGIGASRVELVGHVDADSDNLATIARADIALDPFPFNGGMSTLDTLWMGVPVVSLQGPSLVHRIGLTHLVRAGFADWVTDSAERYVDLAVALAAHPARLAELRRSMRERLRRSILFDAAAHTREVEAAYSALWAERARNAAR